MHGGTLALEGSTESLLQSHNSTTLEDVFLQVCTSSNTMHNTNNDFDDDICKEQEVKWNRTLCCSSARLSCRLNKISFRWSVISAVFVKNFLNLYRFPGALLFVILLPCVQVVVGLYAFGTAIGGIRLTVINEDFGQFGNLYLSTLDPYVIIQKPNNNSCDQEVLDNNNDFYGVLIIRENFSECIHNRLVHFPVVNKKTIDGSEISLQMDHSNYYVNKIIQLELLDSFRKFVTEIAPLISINSEFAEPVIHVSKETADHFRKPASLLLISGIMMLPAYFASAAVTILCQFKEVVNGHMERSQVAGVTSSEVFLGLGILQFLFCLLQNLGLIMVALPTLSVINQGSLILIFCFLCVQGVGGMSFGFFLSMISNQVIDVTIFGSFSLVFAGVISGVFWPIEAMPYFLQYISLILPMALPLRALDFIIHRGWNFFNLQILLGFGVSIAWTFIFLAGTLILHSKKRQC